MPSDSKDDLSRWLNDIAYHIAKADDFVSGLTYGVCKDDDLRFYAVTRCLEIISEASRRLPDELKSRHPADRLIIGPSPYTLAMYQAFSDAPTRCGVSDAASRVYTSDIPILA